MAGLLPFRATWLGDSANWQRLLYVPGLDVPPEHTVNSSTVEQDAVPAFYLCRQHFQLPADGDGLLVREGVMGLLPTPQEAGVIRHEHVYPERVEACRQERRRLQVERSSLFLSCPDPEGALHRAIREDGQPWRQVTDRFGCTHQWSRCHDPQAIFAIQSALRPQHLFLIDGHHRFAAGWRLATVLIRTNALRPFPGAGPDALPALEAEARAGRLLPPKSTDFVPKLMAGMVWHAI